MKEANNNNILVINTPNHNSNSTAEYTIGLMLAEIRNIIRSFHLLKSLQWREYYPNSKNIPEIKNMTVGLLGFGNVARLFAKKLQCFQPKILIHDLYVSLDFIQESNCIPGSYEKLFKESDILSIHVRLAKQTENLISENTFKLMKLTAYLINTGRAAIIDTNTLYKALKENWITGTSVDVFIKEPKPKDEPLLNFDNITLTNHRAGDTLNSYIKAPDIMSDELVRLFNGDKPENIANLEVFVNSKENFVDKEQM